MTNRVEDEFASIEDIRLGIMEDLINRYLAHEFDLRQFTDYVTISRLHYPWPTQFSGGQLRELTAHHLFFFRVGTWPESVFRESLAFLLYEFTEGEGRWKTPMLDRQWLDLMAAGYIPPGVSYHEHTEDSIRAMTPKQRAQLRRKLGMGQSIGDAPL